MNFSELQTVVKDEIIRAGGRLPIPQRLTSYINMGGRAFLIDTKIRRVYEQVAETTHGEDATGHHTFSVDKDTIQIEEVYYDGDQLALTTREELSVFVPGWKTADDGTPESYFVAGAKKVRVHPPVVLADAGNVTADLVLGWSTDMTDADDDPAGDGREVPEAYHMALAYWAANKFAPSARLKSLYDEMVTAARTETLRSSDAMIDRQVAMSQAAQPQQGQ